jgi:hypothetical protein
MENWKGIVGKGFSPEDFEVYVSALEFSDWHPQFIVLHNTVKPTLSQWHSVSGEQRMKNLESFYKDVQKWSAGPHLFIADDLIWAFTPLTTSGIHSPSWNKIAWGVEVVGDFEVESFEGSIYDNTLSALTTLHALRNLDPATLRLHKEDPLTTHNCPGSGINKSDIVGKIIDRVQQPIMHM